MATLDEALKEEYEENEVASERESTCLKDEIRIVLVGKTGAGKSATGNTIAGERIFTSKPSADTVTKITEQHSFTKNGKDIQVIDVPGFCDEGVTQSHVTEEISKCVALAHPGLHAILFVIRIGRYTDVDIQTFKQFKMSFGDVSMKYVVFILTGADDLEADGMELEEYTKDAPESFKQILREIEDRYLLLNNRGSETEKCNFRQKLFDMIKTMEIQNKGYYTNEMFDMAEKTLREEQERELKRIEEEKKVEDELKINRAIEALENDPINKQLKEEELRIIVEKEKEEMKKQIQEEHQREAVRNTREKIGQSIGVFGGAVSGGIISYVGKEAFEYIGTTVGFAIGGPCGAVAGNVIGRVTGHVVTSGAMGYVGQKIGGYVGKKSQE